MLACLLHNCLVRVVICLFNWAYFWLRNILSQFTVLYFCDAGVGPFSPCHPYVRDKGWGGGRTVVRFFVQGDLRHNIKPSFDRRHMSEGTRHFISREWLPTMRTLPIDGEPRIFLYSSSIKRGMTLRRKAKFHAEMHSPPVAFPWPKFLYFLTTGIQALILVFCVRNNARNNSNATWRFRLWDFIELIPYHACFGSVMDVGFLRWFTYLYSFYLILSLKRPPLSPVLDIRLIFPSCSSLLLAPRISKLISLWCSKHKPDFDVLLTVHLSIISVINQLNAQNLVL